MPHLPVITRDIPPDYKAISIGFDVAGLWRQGCDYVGAHISANSQEYEFLRSISGGKPLYMSEYYATPYHVPRAICHEEDVFHRRYRGSMWRGAAHGVIGYSFFVWSGSRHIYIDFYKPAQNFPESVMTTLANHLLLRTFEVRRFSQVSQSFGRVLYEGKPAPRRAAILHSITSTIDLPRRLPDSQRDSEGYQAIEALGWHVSLLDQGIQADYVTESDVLAGRLTDYSVLILPHCNFLPKPVTKRMLEYIQGGGTVIASGAAGVWDEHGRPNRLLYKAIGQDEVFEPRGLVTLADKPVGRGRLVLLGAEVASPRQRATRWELPGMRPVWNCPDMEALAKYRAEWGRWWRRLALKLPAEPHCDDPDVEVSPWQWKGKTFLIVVNLSLDAPKQVEIRLAKGQTVVDVTLAAPVGLRDGMLRTHLLPGAGRVFCVR